jgi:hypothetical protein
MFMKKNVYLFVCGVGLIIALQGLYACAEQNEASQEATKESFSKGSVFSKNTEQKLDDFLSDYVKDLKEALAETDDKKAAVRIQRMQEKYGSRAEELKSEVETWEASLSEEEKKAFEQRAENKPYIKDLLTTSFTAMGRMNKSPELRKAFEELNANVDFTSEDLSTEEATGEEYPEDVVEDGNK